jgi:hypothetical protein
MAKKIANGFLVFILLLTTTGVTFHYHYCGDTLMSFSMFHTPKPCCEHPDNCCHNKETTFQLKKDYVFSVDQPDLTVAGIDLPLSTSLIEDIQPVKVDLKKLPEESPPPKVNLRLAKLQRLLI